ALQYIPFAALPSPESAAGGKEPAALLIDHEIVNLPSASVLRELRQQEARRLPAPKAVAVFADPVFAPTDSRVKMNAVGGRGTAAPARSYSADERENEFSADFTAGLLTRSVAAVCLS